MSEERTTNVDASSPTLDRSYRILHVDDDPLVSDLLRDYLERRSDRFTVEAVTSAREGLDCLADDSYDCVVSDYKMPEMNGLEFLERVRETQPTLPFILLTARGSEQVASEAVRAGVTDYVQKGGLERLELLKNRIEQAIENGRLHRRLGEEREKFRAVFERASDAMLLADDEGRYVDVNPAASELFGESRESMLGKRAADFAPPEFDFETAWAEFASSDGTRGRFPLVRPDGTSIELDFSATPDVTPGLHLSILRPIEVPADDG